MRPHAFVRDPIPGGQIPGRCLVIRVCGRWRQPLPWGVFVRSAGFQPNRCLCVTTVTLITPMYKQPPKTAWTSGLPRRKRPCSL